MTKPINEQPRSQREERARQTPHDNHRRHGRRGIQSKRIHYVGVQRQEPEHETESDDGDGEEQPRDRRVALRRPPVPGHDEGQREAADDDEGEPVLRLAVPFVGVAELDVDPVERGVADYDADS